MSADNAPLDSFPFGSPSAFDESAGDDSDSEQREDELEREEGVAAAAADGISEEDNDADNGEADDDEDSLDEDAIEWADTSELAAAAVIASPSAAAPTSPNEMRFRVLQVNPFDRPALGSSSGLSSSMMPLPLPASGPPRSALHPHPSSLSAATTPHPFTLPVIPMASGVAPPKRRRKAFDSDTDSNSDSSSDSDSDSSRARRRRKKREAILDEESLKPLPRSTELAMRTLMCCIALILLWATSLTLANFLAERWLGHPSWTPVVDQWMSSFSLASREAALYSECGTRVIRGCGLALNNSIIARDRAWRDSEAQAANETLRVEAQAAFCESTSSTLLRSVDSWMQLGAALVYNSACSTAEIDSLRTLLNDRRENKEALSSLTAVYVSTTGQILDDTALQVTAVEQYNSAYISNASLARTQGLTRLNSQLGSISDSSFLGSAVDAKLASIKAATKRMTDCATVKGGANSYCPGGTIVDGYSALLASLLSSYGSLQNLGQSNVRAMTLYSASVTHKLSQIQSFFNLLYPVADALDQIGINVLSIPSLSDLPAMAPNSAFVAALASSVDMPLIDAYYNQRFGAIQNSWNADFEAQRAAVRTQVTGALGNVTGLIQSSFPPDPAAGYDPPAVQPRVELLQAQLDLTSAQFQQEQDARVDRLVAQSGAANLAAEQQLNATLAAAANATTSLDLILPPLSTTQLQMPIAAFTGDFSFSRVVLGMLAAVGGILVVGDLAYRNLASLRVIYQYVRSPQEMLPVIDARTQESKSQDAAAASRSASCADRAAFYLNHSIVLWLFLFGFLVWILIIVAAVYIPLYTSYKDACVRGSSNGTFLTENSHTVLYNYASISGNKEILFALTAYESRRAMACGRYEQRYATQAATQAVTQSEARATQRHAWSNMDLVERCLDPAASFNFTALQAALNATQSLPALVDPMAPITDSLMSSCAVDFSLTASSSSGSSSSAPGQTGFNCTWLPTCVTSVVCPGPNDSAIRASSWDSSCSTEYTLHQSVFFWVLVIVIFLCLNASRIAFNKALVRLGWRALTPAGLTFMATCDHRGEQVTKQEQIERQRRRNKSGSGSSSSSSSASSSARRKKLDHDLAADPSMVGSTPVPRSLLRRYMTAYERSANRYLFLTLLAHVPYLLLLFALSDPLGWGSQLHTAPPKPYNSR